MPSTRPFSMRHTEAKHRRVLGVPGRPLPRSLGVAVVVSKRQWITGRVRVRVTALLLRDLRTVGHQTSHTARGWYILVNSTAPEITFSFINRPIYCTQHRDLILST